MAHRPHTTPRKTASQRRSQATVDALVEATARLLIEEGYDRASTNKIATLAGVSIGSLYQYFPSKEALVAAVVELHCTQELAQVALGAVLKMLRRARSRSAFANSSWPRSRPTASTRRFTVSWPRRRPGSGHSAMLDTVRRNDARTLLRGYLEAHRSEIDATDLDLAAFILVTTVEALTHSRGSAPPGYSHRRKGRRVRRRGDRTCAPVSANGPNAVQWRRQPMRRRHAP